MQQGFKSNLRSFYCELNPLIQFLVDTKAKLLAMPRHDRTRMAARFDSGIRLAAGHVSIVGR